MSVAVAFGTATANAQPALPADDEVGSDVSVSSDPVASALDASLSSGPVASALVRVISLGDVQARVVRGRLVRRRISAPDVRLGSGVVVDARGVVVTAASLVDGARHVVIRGESEDWPAEVALVHEGLALLVLLRDTPLEHVASQPREADAESTHTDRGEALESNDAVSGSVERLLFRDPRSGAIDVAEPSTATDPERVRGGALVNASGMLGVAVDDGPSTRVIEAAQVWSALARAERSGALAAAQRTLRESGEVRHRDGALIRWIVERRSSALRSAAALGEAARAHADPAAQDATLAELTALAAGTDDATLLAYVAASLWDAHIIALEHGGGHATAAGLASEEARAFVLGARAEARRVAMRARRQAPELVERSPLVAYVTGERGDHAPDVPPGPPPAPDRGWFPTLQIGYAHHRGRERHVGHSFQLSGSAPVLLSADPDAVVRTALGLGLGLDWSSFRALERGAGDFETLGLFAVVELGLRVGGPREALLVQLAWLPGGQRGCEGCEETWSRALAAFRVAVGFSARRFNVGLVWRVAAVRAQLQVDLVRQLGAHVGVTF